MRITGGLDRNFSKKCYSRDNCVLRRIQSTDENYWIHVQHGYVYIYCAMNMNVDNMHASGTRKTNLVTIETKQLMHYTV